MTHSPAGRSNRARHLLRAALMACACLAALAAAPAAPEAPKAPAAASPAEATGQTPAQAEVSALDEEVQGLVAQLQQLLPQIVAQRPRLLEESPDLYAMATLRVEQANICRSQPVKSTYALTRARDRLKEALALWKPLVEGKRPDLPQHGLIERAYVAANDMSAQPYAVFVPEDYDGSTPYGLFVFLHGWTPELNKVNWLDLMYSPAVETLARRTRCLVMLPFGRGNTDFQGAGEDDVLRAIQETKAHYKIDEDRVFLSGISMGGMGVWTIGAHSPQLFAALIPIASRADFYMWKRIERGSLPDWKAKLVDGEFGAELVPNYANLPCVIVHGSGDWVMPIEQSERMQSLLEAGGVESTFVRVEGATHYTWDKLLLAPEVLDCLNHARRRSDPRRISFRTYTLKHGRAYWAEVTAIEDWARPAEVTCELDAAGDSLTVHTQNVGALRLQPPARLLAPDKPLNVAWNGAPAHPETGEDGWIELRAPGQPTVGPAKRAGLCGPIREAFDGPFLIVFGGEREGTPFKNAMQAAMDWLTFAQGMPSAMQCDLVSDDLIARCNLILFGTPEDNKLIARIASKLPIKLGGGQYRIGDHIYDATRYGLSMIYPNPLAPDRYVVINSGTIWGTGLAGNHKYDMLPDFIVFTTDVVEDGTDANRAVCAGFFDQHWRLSEASTWYAPEPKGEARAGAGGAPETPDE